MNSKTKDIKLENLSIKDIMIFRILETERSISIPRLIEKTEEIFGQYGIKLVQSYVFALFEKMTSLNLLIKDVQNKRKVTYEITDLGDEFLKNAFVLAEDAYSSRNNFNGSITKKALQEAYDTSIYSANKIKDILEKL